MWERVYTNEKKAEISAFECEFHLVCDSGEVLRICGVTSVNLKVRAEI